MTEKSDISNVLDFLTMEAIKLGREILSDYTKKGYNEKEIGMAALALICHILSARPGYTELRELIRKIEFGGK